jgi:hypothetical protein
MLKFACPHCNVELKAKAETAGHSYDCPKCQGKLTVPTQSALVPVVVPVIVPEIVSDADWQRKLARRRKHRNKGTTPMELTLPKGLGGMKANVSQGTANTIAKTFLGGLLVAIGVVLMAIFGVKPPRSA